MISFAFEGPDGSGKSPCIDIVADVLSRNGLFVHVAKPYRVLGDAGYPLWKTDPMKAAIFVREALDSDIRAAALDGRDVILFDRHWPTAAVSTTDWKAVDLIRQSTLDHLFFLIPSQPKKKEGGLVRPWHVNESDTHWISYRCLVEGIEKVHRPRDTNGRFDFQRIAEVILRCV